MKKIIARLSANNQLSLKYSSRPNCLSGKEQGDLTAQKNLEYQAKLHHRIHAINQSLTHACKEYAHINTILGDMSARATEHVTEYEIIQGGGLIQKVEAPACYIPDTLEWVEIQDGVPEIVKTTYRCLTSEKKRLLDIIEKSQQPSKTDRIWGKPQSLKRFTINAKQHILEAGAVVDRDCGRDNSFELTLTVPGSGYDVYRIVSEWSGWIVNRQTQVIRRLEAKGVEVYWFFVWEHQKRGALHQHWCIAVPDDPMMADYICRQIRKKWWQLLAELSEKTLIDLFRKKGSFGTWRDTPSVWQSSVSPIEKSVAAYFAKYASKNVQTSKYNQKRRETLARADKSKLNRTRQNPVFALCPSRYWGANMRIKSRADELSVNISFDVPDAASGSYIAECISKWIASISDKYREVSRVFRICAPDTGFVYCEGWEQRCWFNSEVYDIVRLIMLRIKSSPLRKKDALGAILDAFSF